MCRAFGLTADRHIGDQHFKELSLIIDDKLTIVNLAAKPHSADVERLISYYNVLKTCGWSSLLPETIKNSLYIKLNMCNVSNFDPHPAVIKWLSDKKRHNKVHPIAKKQEWYEGVFEEARLSQTADEDLAIKDICIQF